MYLTISCLYTRDIRFKGDAPANPTFYTFWCISCDFPSVQKDDNIKVMFLSGSNWTQAPSSGLQLGAQQGSELLQAQCVALAVS